jgi:hypothetical protein
VRKYVMLFTILALSSCGKEQVDNSTTHVVCEQYNYFTVSEPQYEQLASNGELVEVLAVRESDGVQLDIALCVDVIDESRDNDTVSPDTEAKL